MARSLVRLVLSGALLSPAARAIEAQSSGPRAGHAALRVTRLVGDGMVVQRGVAVPVWGWAAAGTPVRVTFDGTPYRTTANAAGEWRVTLPAMRAGGPHTMVVAAGARRIAVRDILVGDVWLCSGQSNMEWPLARVKDSVREIAAGREPRIRHFKVPTSWADAPDQELAGGRWEAADPRTVGRFTAVGWFFATALRRTVDVPIGLLDATWGGSRIETWMSRQALGLDSAAFERVMADERAAVRAAREAVRARLGGALPTADGGLVRGRAVWADPALDERSWATIAVPALWESQGLAGLDGVAWYRVAFALTPDEARRGVRLGLGEIDDSDVTWVNGRRVGGMTNAYNVARVYDVPPSALRAGRNVVAVRVHDTGGGGGIAGAPATVYVEPNGGARRALPASWAFRVGAASFDTDGQRINKVPTVLYNKMVHPLQRYPVAGALWYQGESNANTVEDAAAYRALLPALIADWRRAWVRADLPFLVVQLPSFNPADSAPPARSAWATLREAQSAAASLPNVATVVTIDVGDAADIHPRDKRPVGERLARAARRVAYRDSSVAAAGPTYRAHHVKDGRVLVEFDAPNGLSARAPSGALGGFAIAGADGRFVWADARIEGSRVVVWSDRVPEPVAVRYAWADNPAGANLFDEAGLPAAPFRTDRW